MPIPIPEALDAHAGLAATKATQAKTTLGRYLMSSALAGAYVGFAVILLLMVSAPLVAASHPFTKLVQGGVFGLALTLVVFAGAELFTGNNMFMLQGLLRGKAKLSDLALVWAASLAGNFAGSVGLAMLVDASGIVTAGGAPGTPTVTQSALGAIALGKANLTGGQLFFRAILCNMLVCLAIWMAARAVGDAAKLVCLWWALLAFIASGFEHSVANMTSLSLAALTGAGDWGDLTRNLLYTIPGNIVGGGLFVGAVYGWLGRPVSPAPPAEDALPERPLSAAPSRKRAPAAAKRTTGGGKATATSAARAVAGTNGNGRQR